MVVKNSGKKIIMKKILLIFSILFSTILFSQDLNLKGTPRLMEKKDVDAVYNLYVEQNKKY